jgi:H+/Cl- antiporter ClcA
VTTKTGETAETLRSVTGSGDETSFPGTPVTAAHPVHPYVHVVVIAVIGAVSVLAWLVVYETVNGFLWEIGFVTAIPWLFPVICLPFSLLVGLLVKYRHAPTNLDGSMLDSLSGDVSKIDWRSLPVTVVMALVSLFSGAVIGPEGGIGGIASKIAALYNDKVGVPAEHRSRLVFSTLASAYNGLIANPLFTGVLGSELIKDPEARSRNLPANLIGGSIGFLIFFAVGSTGLENYLHLDPSQPFSPRDIPLVVLFGLLGLVLALFAGALFRISATFFGRFQGREVERALVAGVIFSAVGMMAPILLFSGEAQIQAVVANPAQYGSLQLVAMALVKLALLAVAFKSGFLGGDLLRLPRSASPSPSASSSRTSASTSSSAA